MSTSIESGEDGQEFQASVWPAYLFLACGPIAIILGSLGLIFSSNLPNHPPAEKYGEYLWIVLGVGFTIGGLSTLRAAKTSYVVTNDALIIQNETGVVRTIPRSQIVSAVTISTRGGQFVSIVLSPHEKLQFMCDNDDELVRLLQPKPINTAGPAHPTIVWGSSED